MSTENIHFLIENKKYNKLYSELITFYKDFTPSDLVNEGFEYLDARLCKLLVKMGKEIVSRIDNLKMEVVLILTIGNEKGELITEILDSFEKEGVVPVEELSMKLIEYRTKQIDKKIKKEEEILIEAFDRFSLMHVASKAEQFGEITKRNRNLLIDVSKFVIPKKKFASKKQMDYFKHVITKLYNSKVASKPCGNSDKPCVRCLDIEESLSSLFERGDVIFEGS